MNGSKIPGISITVMVIVLFGVEFGRMHFGYYVPPPNTPAVVVTVFKWVIGFFALAIAWALVIIIRAPAPK